jgi:MoaA/NifB/PqqE/SkfB family radical SAM enzyme
MRAYNFNYDSVINYLEEEIKKNKIKKLETIGLTGGETTICPDFFRIMNYISDKFPEVIIRLLTNGRMLAYDVFREKCLTFRKIDFIIPLHGYDAKSHDRVTQTPGSFNQTIKGLKKLFQERKVGQKIEIRIVATRLNFRIIPRILELIKKRFAGVERVVLIFLEFEGEAEKNKNKVGITYQKFQPVLKRIKKYSKLFKDLRLYHFPLCVLEPYFWPYAWRTLPAEEITFLPECQKCALKKYCLGIHKSYLSYVKKPEIQPRLSLKGIKIQKSKNFYKPISSIYEKN